MKTEKNAGLVVGGGDSRLETAVRSTYRPVQRPDPHRTLQTAAGLSHHNSSVAAQPGGKFLDWQQCCHLLGLATL